MNKDWLLKARQWLFLAWQWILRIFTYAIYASVLVAMGLFYYKLVNVQ